MLSDQCAIMFITNNESMANRLDMASVVMVSQACSLDGGGGGAGVQAKVPSELVHPTN